MHALEVFRMSDQQIQTEGLGSAVAVEGGDFA